jgi:acyl-CoA synthetase (AMP-forming)/AMP-acid ligase II
MYTHRSNFLHALAVALPDCLDVKSTSTILMVVPMFHANSWWVGCGKPRPQQERRHGAGSWCGMMQGWAGLAAGACTCIAWHGLPSGPTFTPFLVACACRRGLAFAGPMMGAKLVLPGPYLDGASVYKLLEEHKVTTTAVRCCRFWCCRCCMHGVCLPSPGCPLWWPADPPLLARRPTAAAAAAAKLACWCCAWLLAGSSVHLSPALPCALPL